MSSETRSVTWTIGKATPVVTPPVGKTLDFTGGAQDLITAGSATGGTLQYKLGDGEYGTAIPKAAEVGTYTVYYRVVGDNNWNDVAQSSVTASIEAQTVTLPTQSGTLTYNRSEQEPSWSGYDDTKLTLGGVSAATNAGTYTATFAPKTGYVWADTGTTEARDATWAIDTAKVSLPTQSGSLTYDGTEQSPSWTSYPADAFTIAGTTEATNAGNYNASFTPTANYEWAD